MRRAVRLCAVSMSLAAMLPACAPTADRWSKEGASAEHRDSTFASCRAEANARTSGPVPSYAYQQATSSGGVVGILVGALVVGIVHSAAQGAAANVRIDSCMKESGFTKPQPAVNADGYRNDTGAPDVGADGRRTDTRGPVKTNTGPGASPQSSPVSEPAPATPNTEKSSKPLADCGEAAISPLPRSSLLANQPPPVSCTSTRPAPPKAGRAS